MALLECRESFKFRQGIVYNSHKLYALATRRSECTQPATPQNTLEAFNQLPRIEKHAIASEIIKQVALLNFSPITYETLTEIADALFTEHDKREAEDAEAN